MQLLVNPARVFEEKVYTLLANFRFCVAFLDLVALY